jgi:protein tyrosine/serine phosphatase
MMGLLVVTAALALAELQSPTGPSRFGVVRDGLYRGGQPSAHHLELLRALGVETIIDLRYGGVAAEEAEARRLGMRVVRFPFSGLFVTDLQFLARVVEAMRSGGRVYVHCHEGRDRTSLVVALYRVLVDGWEEGVAWQREAVAYGYVRWPWHPAIEASYRAALRARR